MGQSSCQCANNQNLQIRTPKCALLYQQMLSEFELPDKENCEPLSISNCFSSESAKLPNKYTDLFMLLNNSRNKYTDTFFPPENMAIYLSIKPDLAKQKWERISYFHSSPIVQTKVTNSKFCEVFKFINENLKELSESIKPIFIESAGFAICNTYINGERQEIIVDDYIPESRINLQVEPWILLLEKSFAKALGCYEYIEQFSIGQIFSEITGIPYYLGNQSPQDVKIQEENNRSWKKHEAKSFSSFKDALKCDEILYQTRRFRNDVSIFGFRSGLRLFPIEFTCRKNKPNFLFMKCSAKSVMSIRVIQSNKKYKEVLSQDYSPVYLQGMKQEGSKYGSIGFGKRFENCIYFRETFTEMDEGIYWFYIKQFEEESKLTLIIYSKNEPKLRQSFDTSSSLLSKQINSSLREKQRIFQEVGESVFASIHSLKGRISLYFEANYPKKRIRLSNPKSSFCLISKNGDEHSPTESYLNLDAIFGKWVVIFIFQPSSQHYSDYFNIVKYD